MRILDRFQRKGDDVSFRKRLKQFNRNLVFMMIYMALCALNFGYDVGTFSGIQGMQSFTKQFGVFDERLGLYMLPGWLASVMTATPFLGKGFGCIFCGWIAQKHGRRAAVLWLCIFSIIGVILQVAATTAAQFTIGRIITYIQTGMAIVVIPIYQAETAPKLLRGMFGSTTQLMIVFGSLIATLVTFATKSVPGAKGWQIPAGLQFLIPVVILLFLPLMPESPRWLLSQRGDGKREEAIKSLRILRRGAKEEDVQIEIDAICTLNAAAATMGKGTWKEVFDKRNRRRTAVAVLAMFGQQITGQAFPTQYGVVFYQTQGFKSQAFLFNMLGSVISLVAVVITWTYVDVAGRRPVLLVGGTMMGAFLFILGGLGSVPGGELNGAERNTIVASLMMFTFAFNMSWAPVSYVVVSEVAALRVKEKTNLLACLISVITTFATSFSMPYLIYHQYANLGAKVGYIYGSLNVMMVVLTYFFVPELKDRTLDEVDQLFESGLPLRKFRYAETRSMESVCRDKLPVERVSSGLSELRAERRSFVM